MPPATALETMSVEPVGELSKTQVSSLDIESIRTLATSTSDCAKSTSSIAAPRVISELITAGCSAVFVSVIMSVCLPA